MVTDPEVAAADAWSKLTFVDGLLVFGPAAARLALEADWGIVVASEGGGVRARTALASCG